MPVLSCQICMAFLLLAVTTYRLLMSLNISIHNLSYLDFLILKVKYRRPEFRINVKIFHRVNHGVLQQR